MEKALNFKIDVELYKRIKIKAVLNDMTLKQYIVQLITDDLEKEINLNQAEQDTL